MLLVILGTVLAFAITYIVYILLPGSHDESANTSLDAFIIKSEGTISIKVCSKNNTARSILNIQYSSAHFFALFVNTYFKIICLLQDDGQIKAVEKKNENHYNCSYDKPGRQILIIFGTEYGFSEEIAKKLFDRLGSISCIMVICTGCI